MVGDWLLVPDHEAATKQAGAMRMTVRWDEGCAFLVREATLTPPEESGEPVVTLQQRIGSAPPGPKRPPAREAVRCHSPTYCSGECRSAWGRWVPSFRCDERL